MDIQSAVTGKRAVSLPFTDYCEPIAANAVQFQELFHAATAYGKKRNWKRLEIRGGANYFQNEKPSESYYGHVLDLTAGSSKIFAGLRDSTRRNIKKAEKQNIDLTISHSAECMKDFCRLNAMTRKEHGLPPQPRHFFQHIYDEIMSKKLGFIVVASYNRHAVAANVYLHAGDRVLYKYGASDKAWQHLRVNNLVMWEAIKWSCDNGYRTMCFGRTEQENNGLRQFKTGWGAREYVIFYYTYDLEKGTFIHEPHTINPLYKKIFGKLPIPILQAMGNLAYRHMG